jgi:citrate synthase
MNAGLPYSPGLENVIATITRISTIDTENHRILLRGYDLIELAKMASYEQAVYVLLYGKFPSDVESEAFQKQLLSKMSVPETVYEVLAKLPSNIHPMDAVRIGISVLAAYEQDLECTSVESNLEKGLRLIATTPVIVGNGFRIFKKLKPLEPIKEKGLSYNLLRLLKGAEPDAFEARIFEQTMILYIEHELAASTFTARVVASTLSDIYNAVCAAISALKGPLHGRANEKVMQMLLEIGDASKADQYIEGLLMRKERVMGFGHRVYKKGIDPRALLAKDLLKQLASRRGAMIWYELADRIEKLMKEKKDLYPNVDFFTGPLYYIMGIEVSQYTPIFVAARMAGWVAHVVEQQSDNRIFRPRALYQGPSYIPLSR